jgi:membrane protein YdbS with pleckstrin-like domain
MFQNPEIASSDLPPVENVDWQPLDERYILRLYTGAAIKFAVILTGVSIFRIVYSIAVANQQPAISFNWLFLIPIIVGIALVAWPLISVPKMGFVVRDKDILYKSGVFWHTVTAIPFNRVQHVEKSSTPLDRRFDIATLQLFTAGGSGGDLKIHGLSARVAEKLRTFVLEKIGSIVEHH